QTARPLRVARPDRLRDEDRAADAERGEGGHQEEHDLEAAADARDRRSPEAGDEPGVHDAEEGLEQVLPDHRPREAEDAAVQRFGLHWRGRRVLFDRHGRLSWGREGRTRTDPSGGTTASRSSYDSHRRSARASARRGSGSRHSSSKMGMRHLIADTIEKTA